MTPLVQVPSQKLPQKPQLLSSVCRLTQLLPHLVGVTPPQLMSRHDDPDFM